MTATRPPAGTAILPTAGRDRVEVIDALRGFALFGVVVINMSVDTMWSDHLVARTPSLADDAIARGLATFGAGRFLTIFSFLFGLGVFMQIDRCQARGVKPGPLLFRRLLVLLAMGLMHYLLVGWTDILHVYAVLGMVLVAMHRLRTRALLVTALTIMALNVGEPKPLVLMAGERLLQSIGGQRAPVAPSAAVAEGAATATTIGDEVDRLTGIFVEGSYADIVRESVRDFRDYIRYFAPRWWFASLLPVVLIGAYVARRRILERVDAHLPVLRRVFYWGLALGLLGSLMTLLRDTLWTDRALPFYARQLAAASDYVGIRALGFAYASGFVLAARHATVARRLAPLAAVGRTAFTNYLLQTGVAVIVFFGVGFGLYGRVNPVVGVLIATLTFAAQIAGSVWWLSRFRYGPAEWAWRSLTYGRLQPLRREE